MEDKTKIDELFKGGLGDFEAEPPEASWQAIQAELAREKRKKRMAYWRIAGTAAAIVLAFFTGYFFQPDGKEYRFDENIANQPPAVAPQETLKQKTTPTQENVVGKSNSNSLTNHEAQQTSTEKPGGDFEPPYQSQDLVSGESAQQKAEGSSIAAVTADSDPNSSSPDSPGAALNEPDLTPIMEINPKSIADAPVLEQEMANALPAIKIKSTEQELAVVPEPPQLKQKLDKDEITYYEDKVKKPTLKKGFELGLVASPTLAFSDVSVDPNTASQYTSSGLSPANNHENIGSEDEVMNSYSAGFNLAYRTSSRWEIGTGLQLNNWKQVTRDVVMAGQPSSTSTNSGFEVRADVSTGNVSYSVGSSADTNKVEALSSFAYRLVPDIQQNYQFVEIPLNVGFYAIDSRKWYLKLQAGFTGRFLNSSDVQLQFEDGTREDYPGLELQKFSLQLMGGTGVGFKATENLHLNITPSILYGLTPVNRNESVETYFHQILIYSGLSYRF